VCLTEPHRWLRDPLVFDVSVNGLHRNYDSAGGSVKYLCLPGKIRGRRGYLYVGYKGLKRGPSL
jgi:hypothetical protein